MNGLCGIFAVSREYYSMHSFECLVVLVVAGRVQNLCFEPKYVEKQSDQRTREEHNKEHKYDLYFAIQSREDRCARNFSNSGEYRYYRKWVSNPAVFKGH